ncbi:unnamed protein product [Bursaphelenchus okinawaensis]|uniref:Peptidase M13 C-terminal domain-containing protein n=1 Tax=Bursaphelenchus okinawaensis TaxID=465554 RepID=A0A811KJR0_9BILA|nr:unnamed protein product [Bursaphelenchus okinawaensis]CAG9105144.1 unnamed protein product [Bursaphelenchus okinawaensis]
MSCPLGTGLKDINEDYIEKLFCLIGFYEGQCDPTIPELCLDSEATLEENFADTVGARLAYNTYKKWVSIKGSGPRPKGTILDTFSDDQLFFINAAQNFLETIDWTAYDPQYTTHPPREVRTWGSLAGNPAFANAFNCKPTSKYNPSNRCFFFEKPE